MENFTVSLENLDCELEYDLELDQNLTEFDLDHGEIFILDESE